MGMRALLLLGAAFVLAACGQSLSPTTGIAVALRRGPIAPVEQPGVDNTAPVPGGTVVVLQGGRLVASATTDSAGTAMVPVAAGDYRVQAATCPGALALPAPVSVTVTAGMLAPAHLECDTGIR
jgi:hypothetical protein